jgi:type I restriction enzyme S subunit
MSGGKKAKLSQWQSVQLVDVCTLERGRFSVRPRNDPDYYGGQHPFVQTGDVANSGGIIRKHTQTLNDRGLRVSKKFPAGTLLITIAAHIGECATLSYPACCPDSVVGAIPQVEKVDATWLRFALWNARDQMLRLAPQNAQANLNLELLGGLQLLLPPLDEQRRIANALAMWDRAIETAEALVAAKRRQYEALRQRLIDDHQRNAGAEDGWRNIEFGKLAEELGERNRGRLSASSVMGVLKSQGIVPMREHVMANDLDRYLVVPPGAFAYNPMRLNIGSIAQSSHAKDILVSPDYVVFAARAGKGAPAFIRHFIGTKRWRDTMELAASGSVRLRIYFDGLAEMTLRAPSIKQQEQIAAVLDAAQKEISLANKNLEALRTQKRGMMQKLLTGEWRLPARASEAAA